MATHTQVRICCSSMYINDPPLFINALTMNYFKTIFFLLLLLVKDAQFPTFYYRMYFKVLKLAQPILSSLISLFRFHHVLEKNRVNESAEGEEKLRKLVTITDLAMSCVKQAISIHDKIFQELVLITEYLLMCKLYNQTEHVMLSRGHG